MALAMTGSEANRSKARGKYNRIRIREANGDVHADVAAIEDPIMKFRASAKVKRGFCRDAGISAYRT